MVLISRNGKSHLIYLSKFISINLHNPNQIFNKSGGGLFNYSRLNIMRHFSTEEKKIKILKATNYMQTIVESPSKENVIEEKSYKISEITNKFNPIILKPELKSGKNTYLQLKLNPDSKPIPKEKVPDKIEEHNYNSTQNNSISEELNLKNSISKKNNFEIQNETNLQIEPKIKISFNILDPSNIQAFLLMIKEKPEASLVILEKNLLSIFSSKENLISNFSLWLDYFSHFISNVVFYPNKLDLFPKYKEILNILSLKLNLERQDSSYKDTDLINQLLINFILNKIRVIQYPDTIFIFHFFYTLLSNLFQDKSLFFELKITLYRENLNSREDTHELIKIKKVFPPDELYTNLLENFPYSIKDFNPIKNEINELCELVIIYQYNYFKLKGTSKDSFSMMMSNFDEMIGKYLENNLKSDLFNFLTLGCIKIKQPGFNYMLLPNIYSVLCKKFNLENLTNQPGYIFLHSKFLRDYFKEFQTSKTLTALSLSNIFYLGDALRTEKVLQGFSNDLIIHLIYVFTQVRYEIDKELLEEINLRLESILKEFNYSHIHTLVASLAMIQDSVYNQEFQDFFKKVLTHRKMERINTKHFLNIGFYISMTRLDDFNAWSIWFQNFSIKRYRFNDFDCKMLKDLKKNLEIMIGPQYGKFSTINTIEGNNLKTVAFQRWFYSKDLGFYSNSDVMILKYLKKFNLNFSTQVMLGDMFLCDFLLGDKIVLELNGPHHYYCTNLLKLESKAKFKKEFLEKLGYYVVCINIITINKFSKIGTGPEIMNIVKASVPENEYDKIFKLNKII